nr:MAG TPA: hypothetical protein [Caudoviricetes sp.]
MSRGQNEFLRVIILCKNYYCKFKLSLMGLKYDYIIA